MRPFIFKVGGGWFAGCFSINTLPKNKGKSSKSKPPPNQTLIAGKIDVKHFFYSEIDRFFNGNYNSIYGSRADTTFSATQYTKYAHSKRL